METWTEEDARAAAVLGFALIVKLYRYCIVGIDDNGTPMDGYLWRLGVMYDSVQRGDLGADVATLYRKALALHGQPVPAPKREPPTLLEAAQEWKANSWPLVTDGESIRGLLAAIAREELKSADVECARCGKSIPQDFAFVEEGDEWECARCWHRCEEKELRDEIARLKASPATNEKLREALRVFIGNDDPATLVSTYRALILAAKDAGIIP